LRVGRVSLPLPPFSPGGDVVRRGFGWPTWDVQSSCRRLAGLPVLGFMTVVRSGFPDHGDQIWDALGFLLLVFRLLWSELGV
jgi:hypothetical protein